MAANGVTTQEVSTALTITPGGINGAILLKIDSYYGFASKAIWEWLAVKATETEPMSETNRTPDEFAQGTPDKVVRSLGEINTANMVFELQKTAGEIQEALGLLAPKIDDVAGFIRHRAPDLASKSDVIQMKAELQTAIDLRPTRRQAIFDMAWVVELIIPAVSFGGKFAH